MYKLVGLDLDGTLIDSAPDLCDALGRALESLRLPAPSEDQTRSWIGDGIEALVARAIAAAANRPPSTEEAASALSVFDAFYRERYFVRSSPYPHVIETLKAIRSRGIATVCITNKRARFAEPVLAAAGLDAYLDAIFGGDTLPRKKPAPDQLDAAAAHFGVVPEKAVMVGDSPNDLDAARAAGWDFVFARYGYTSAMQERGIEPSPCVDDFAELIELVV